MLKYNISPKCLQGSSLGNHPLLLTPKCYYMYCPHHYCVCHILSLVIFLRSGLLGYYMLPHPSKVLPVEYAISWTSPYTDFGPTSVPKPSPMLPRATYNSLIQYRYEKSVRLLRALFHDVTIVTFSCHA